MGVAKRLPFKAHPALDALPLGVTPFITGQYRNGPRRWVPHIVLCAFEWSAVAMTDPSGCGEVKAVREANPMRSEDRAVVSAGPRGAEAA
jgi:hypothetical protein